MATKSLWPTGAPLSFFLRHVLYTQKSIVILYEEQLLAIDMYSLCNFIEEEIGTLINFKVG